MSDDLIGGNSGTAVAEPTTGQSAPASTGTSDQNGQAASTQAQSAPAEESFSSIDPNTLPPELQAVYKSMQSDYTKKLQPIADMRKKADAFDKVSSRSDFRDWWSGATKEQKADFKEQKAEAEKTLGQKISDEEFTKGFQSKDDFLSLIEKVVTDRSEKSQKKIEQLEQKLSVKDAESYVDQFATEVGKDGKPVRPDFYSLDDDRLITGYLQLSIDPNKGIGADEYAQKLNEAYSWAKGISQKYYEKGKAEALQIIQKKAAASTEPPTGAAKGAYTGPDPKKMSVREAMELAKKNIRVPRDD
jgi:hypothetical protein